MKHTHTGTVKYAYFPGCSQHATGRAVSESLLAIAPRLGIELEEIDDWNCCGATAMMGVNELVALALGGRNLALAEPQGAPVVTPCPACWMSLHRSADVLAEGGERAEKLRDALSAGGLEIKGTAEPKHLLEVLVADVGLERIRESVKKPLNGLAVAPYYGCQLVRPYQALSTPRSLELLIEALGGKPVALPAAETCCGGALVTTQPDLGQNLSGGVLQSAAGAGADVVVTPCPLCMVNLELASGSQRSPLPVVFVTQLLGLAMGLEPTALGLHRGLSPQMQTEFPPQLPAAGGGA